MMPSDEHVTDAAIRHALIERDYHRAYTIAEGYIDSLKADRDRLAERVKELEGWIDKGESPVLHEARQALLREGMARNEAESKLATAEARVKGMEYSLENIHRSAISLHEFALRTLGDPDMITIENLAINLREYLDSVRKTKTIPDVSITELTDAESKLDELFLAAFEANHPAMLEYVKLKFVTKELRRQNTILTQRLAAMEEALKFYADAKNYENNTIDYGRRAKQALEGKGT